MVVFALVVLAVSVVGVVAAVVGFAAERVQRRHMVLVGAVLLSCALGVGIGVLGHMFTSALNPNRVFVIEGDVSGMNADRTSLCVTPQGASSGEQVCAAPIEGVDVDSFTMRDEVTAGFAQYHSPDGATAGTTLLFLTAASSNP